MFPTENEAKQMREKFRNFFLIGICPFLKSYYLLCSLGLELTVLIKAFESGKSPVLPNQYAHTELCIKIKLQYPVPTLLQNNAALTDWKASLKVLLSIPIFSLCYSVEEN